MICSWHFEGGKKSAVPRKNAYNRTIFSDVYKCKKLNTSDRADILLKRKEKLENSVEVSDAGKIFIFLFSFPMCIFFVIDNLLITNICISTINRLLQTLTDIDIKKLMHHLYSSIISQKIMLVFLNESNYCIYIKSFNLFL